MLLGFKRMFESYVKDGSKTHTIRAKRELRPRVGETCHCYGDVRQKTMHKLGRWPCSRIQDIQIVGKKGFFSPVQAGVIVRPGHYQAISVVIDGTELDANEKDMLAWKDGFRYPKTPNSTFGCFDLMVDFWVGTHGKGSNKDIEFDGDMIHWDFTKPVTKK